MCYYATTDYRCGDWKWGNMKLRCPRQHRIGETCGAKLVHHESVTKVNEECRLCQEINIKRRRLQKEIDNISRWRREGNKFSASIEKAERESRQLEQTIQEMVSRRPSVMMNRGGPSSVGTTSGSQPSSAASRRGSVDPYTSTAGYGSNQYGGLTVYPNRTDRHSNSYHPSPNSGSNAPNRHAAQYPAQYSSRR